MFTFDRSSRKITELTRRMIILVRTAELCNQLGPSVLVGDVNTGPAQIPVVQSFVFPLSEPIQANTGPRERPIRERGKLALPGDARLSSVRQWFA
ncbi:hypothetical protein RRG08_036623 [Elysia crispata]|uniref:Uncharacterized protein n=1 Tax=Elysia crispata TaxID=231223 RepID=A0AAE1A3P9_9GAST|nr:hypothetical protein RRG08_036623 [Elysia crispata]